MSPSIAITVGQAELRSVASFVGFSCMVMWRCRSNPGVAQWWATLQKTQAQHWLTGLLSARLSSAPVDKHAAPSLALLPTTCELNAKTSMAPGSTGQQQLQNPDELILERICSSLRSCRDAAQVGTCTCPSGNECYPKPLSPPNNMRHAQSASG